MLPRSKSIFYLGEEGGEEAKSWASTGGSPESLVGLQMLVEHHTKGSNIIVNSGVRARRLVGLARRTPNNVSEFDGFLKTCLSCKRELSLQKEIYMYRGDQGFCSDECRCRQILLDERKDFEASTRERLRVPHHRTTGPKVRDSGSRGRIPVAT